MEIQFVKMHNFIYNRSRVYCYSASWEGNVMGEVVSPRVGDQLGIKQNKYKVHCDSQSALDLSKNSMYHSHMKHIDVRYH